MGGLGQIYYTLSSILGNLLLKKPMVSLNLPTLNCGLRSKPPVNIRGF